MSALAWTLLPLAGAAGAWGRFRTEASLKGFLARRGLAGNPARSAHPGRSGDSARPGNPGRHVPTWLRRTVVAWPIAAINLVGCFVAGLAAPSLSAYPAVWLVVATGFLGGWTTFSTAMMDLFTIASTNLAEARETEGRPALDAGALAAAAAVGFATLLLTVAAALAGLALGAMIAR